MQQFYGELKERITNRIASWRRYKDEMKVNRQKIDCKDSSSTKRGRWGEVGQQRTGKNKRGQSWRWQTFWVELHRLPWNEVGLVVRDMQRINCPPAGIFYPNPPPLIFNWRKLSFLSLIFQCHSRIMFLHFFSYTSFIFFIQCNHAYIHINIIFCSNDWRKNPVMHKVNMWWNSDA